jgi:hypothetical protein
MAFAELGLAQFGPEHPDTAKAQVWATMLVAEQIAAAAEPLHRIAAFLDQLGDEMHGEVAEKLAAAQVIERKFGELLEPLAMGANDGAHHKDWVLDQIARTLLGPAYDEWAAANEWSNVTDNAIAP